jgi:hypothetical protein
VENRSGESLGPRHDVSLDDMLASEVYCREGGDFRLKPEATG